MKNRICTLAICTSLSAFVVSQSTTASAQQKPADDKSGEIVVTAQKRSQSTSDVPLSVTAVSGSAISQLGITESAQLAEQVPGLTWGGTSGKSKPTIFLRGVGNADFQAGSNSPIGTYNDGVYQGDTFGYAALLMDLNRVEVLRGPQGTLWGKNTTGGIINYVPNLAKVGQDPNGDVSVGYGNFNAVNVEAAAGVPLGDKFAVRVAGGLTRDDGQFYSTNPATRGPIGGSNWKGIRGSIAYQPTPDLKIVAAVTFSDVDGQTRQAKTPGVFDPTKPFTFTPCTLPNPGFLGTACGDITGFVASSNPYQVNPPQLPMEKVRKWSPTLSAEWQLGGITLNSITAYNHSMRDEFMDADSSTANLYEYDVQDRFHSVSQELRLSSAANQRFSWIAGLYAYSDRTDLYQALVLPVFGSPSAAHAFINKSQNYAVFGDASYKLSDSLTLSGGLRLTRDQRQASGIAFEFAPNFGQFNTKAQALANIVDITGDFTAGTRRADDNLSGRVGLEYRPKPGLLLYAHISRGFKGGDLNSGATVPGTFYITKPETLTSYEAGIKTSVWNNLLQFDAAGYYYDYKNVQSYTSANSSAGVQLVLSNAGALRIYGLDGNITLNPARGLRANLGFAYVNSTYTSYIDPLGGTDFTGNTTPFTSKFQLSPDIDYNIPLANGGAIELQTDGVYRTRYFFSAANLPQLEQKAFAMVNASATYHFPNSKLSLKAWGKNLTGKVTYVDGYDFTFVGAYFVLPGDRRTFGGTLRYEF